MKNVSPQQAASDLNRIYTSLKNDQEQPWGKPSAEKITRDEQINLTNTHLITAKADLQKAAAQLASVEKQLKEANDGLQTIEKKLKTLPEDYSAALSRSDVEKAVNIEGLINEAKHEHGLLKMRINALSKIKEREALEHSLRIDIHKTARRENKKNLISAKWPEFESAFLRFAAEYNTLKAASRTMENNGLGLVVLANEKIEALVKDSSVYRDQVNMLINEADEEFEAALLVIEGKANR